MDLPMRRMNDTFLDEGADRLSRTMTTPAVRLRPRFRQTVKSAGRDVNRQVRGFARACGDRSPALPSRDKSVTLPAEMGYKAMRIDAVSTRSEQG
jgi:hypothetical protein